MKRKKNTYINFCGGLEMLKFKSSNLFKKVIDAVRDVCKETTFQITPEALTMQCMDSSHVCLVSLRLTDSLEISSQDDMVMSLNLSNLYKVICTLDTNSPATINIVDNKVQIISDSLYRKCDSLISLMDIEMDPLMIPDMDFPITIVLSSTEFVRLVKDMSEFGDSIRITAEPGKVIFRTFGDITDMQITFTEHDNCILDIKSSVEVDFSLKYLLMFLKATSLSEKSHIHLGEDTPMKVEYKISDQDSLCFYLAPKVAD